MGNEPSTLVDEDTPPSALEARTLEAVAKYIKAKDDCQIVVMVCLPNFPFPPLFRLTRSTIGGRWD